MTFMQVRGQALEIPSTNDFNANASTINDVENTGVDFVNTMSDYSKVMVYDGEMPSFAWDKNAATGIYPFSDNKITDPDVILTNNQQQ
jgi:hypothetical protein